MSKLEKLRKQRNELDVQIRDIEDKLMEEKILPSLKKRIGKCYVYINSYGGGSEKWNLYHRVLNVDEEANYIIDSFQQCSDGRIEIETKTKFNYSGRDSLSDSSYKEITIEEYQEAQKKLLKVIKKVLT